MGNNTAITCHTNVRSTKKDIAAMNAAKKHNSCIFAREAEKASSNIDNVSLFLAIAMKMGTVRKTTASMKFAEIVCRVASRPGRNRKESQIDITGQNAQTRAI